MFTAAGAVYVASKPKMVLNDRVEVAATFAPSTSRPPTGPVPP